MTLQNDYTEEILQLPPDYEGTVKAVLIASKHNTGTRKCCLYLHGYVDYFFHPHLGEAFNKHGYDFYALDLRKYGRALMPHQHPNYCKSLTEYFEEISIAIKKIKTQDQELFLLGHSTGGLIASCYMNAGAEKELVNGLLLNSPFLDFNFTYFEKALSQSIAQVISKFSDFACIKGALSPAYAQSIHKSFHGKWDFNLDWKPIEGFPTYFMWVQAIFKAQKTLEQSAIKVPILIMHASSSCKLSKFSDQAMKNDIVLNVDDIQRVGRQLGQKITWLKLANAQHDIFLSSERVQERAFNAMFLWLKNSSDNHSSRLAAKDKNEALL